MLHRTNITRSASVILSAGLLTGAGVAASAQTDVSTVTAVIAESVASGRTINAVGDLTLVSTGAATSAAALAVTITEVAETGSANWYVTLDATAMQDVTDTYTIPNSALMVGTRTSADTGVVTGVSSSAPTGGEDLSATRTLMTVAGQNILGLYTGVYASASTITLTVPNGTLADTYDGTITVTLVD